MVELVLGRMSDVDRKTVINTAASTEYPYYFMLHTAICFERFDLN